MNPNPGENTQLPYVYAFGRERGVVWFYIIGTATQLHVVHITYGIQNHGGDLSSGLGTRLSFVKIHSTNEIHNHNFPTTEFFFCD